MANHELKAAVELIFDRHAKDQTACISLPIKVRDQNGKLSIRDESLMVKDGRCTIKMSDRFRSYNEFKDYIDQLCAGGFRVYSSETPQTFFPGSEIRSFILLAPDFDIEAAKSSRAATRTVKLLIQGHDVEVQLVNGSVEVKDGAVAEALVAQGLFLIGSEGQEAVATKKPKRGKA